jgi:hypothetical protein
VSDVLREAVARLEAGDAEHIVTLAGNMAVRWDDQTVWLSPEYAQDVVPLLKSCGQSLTDLAH